MGNAPICKLKPLFIIVMEYFSMSIYSKYLVCIWLMLAFWGATGQNYSSSKTNSIDSILIFQKNNSRTASNLPLIENFISATTGNNHSPNAPSNNLWSNNENFDTVQKVYSSNKSVKFGTKDTVGVLISKSLNLTGNFKIVVCGKGWGNNAGILKISLVEQPNISQTMSFEGTNWPGEFTTQTVTMHYSGTSSIKFESMTNGKRLFIDSIAIVALVPNSIPFLCTFEEEAENEQWILRNEMQTNQWWIGTATNHGGNKSLYISKDSSTHNLYSDTLSRVFAYRFVHLDAGNYRFSYDWKSEGERCCDYLRTFLIPDTVLINPDFFISSESTLPSYWISMDRDSFLCNSAFWTTQIIETNISESLSGDYQLVFYWINNELIANQPPAAIDNISISNISCFTPYNLQAICNTSAFLQWTENGTATKWEVEYGLNGFNFGEGTRMIVENHSTIIIREIEFDQNYQFYVRSICEEGDTSFWSDPCSFRMVCSPVEIPFEENFEGYSCNYCIPNCWERIGTATNAFIEHFETSNHLSISSNIVAVMPELDFTNIASLKVNFDGKATSNDSLFIGIMSSSDDIATFESIDTVVGTNNNEGDWKHYSVSFANYSNIGKYIGFKTIEDNSFRLDNIVISRRDSLILHASDSVICHKNEIVLTIQNVIEENFNGLRGNDNSNNSSTVQIPDGSFITDKKFFKANQKINEAGNAIKMGVETIFGKITSIPLNLSEPFSVFIRRKGWGKVSNVIQHGELKISVGNQEQRVPAWGFSVWPGNYSDTLIYFDASTDGATMEIQTFDNNGKRRAFIDHLSIYTVPNAGYSYLWSNGETNSGITVSPDTTTTYWVTITNDEGFETTFSKTIIVNDNFKDVIVDACDSYTWNNEIYTESGDYVQTFQNALGCDSVVTLHLTINESETYEFAATACDSYIWNQETYTESGDYVQTFQNALGCDSVVTLHLIINESETYEFTTTACNEYTWNQETYTASGDYVQTFQNALGCDSVVTLRLTINESETYEFAVTACNEYTWNNTTYTESGDYIQLFQNTFGCDSVVTLHLTINESETYEFAVTACDSYTWNNEMYTESGVYVQEFENALGCDSVVTLHLTINESETYEFTTTACNEYTWNQETYTASGDYVQTFQNALCCDSVVTLRLTINESETYEFAVTACNEYTWNNTNYTESGDYVQTFQNALGCDSVVTLHLTINESETNEFAATACNEYTWNNEIYTTSGDYVQTFQNAHGCDSVVTLHLTINESETYEFAATACDEYTWNNEIYTESGDYVQTFQNALGCDSVVTLHLTINESETYEFAATSCEEFTWNNEIYTVSGDYVQTFQNALGCDSVVTLHLTINESETNEFATTDCDEYIWNNTNYTTSGDYVQTFQNALGCDSIVILHLIVHATPSIPSYTITENTVCNGIPDGSITIISPIGTDYEYSINETNYQQNTVFSQLNSGVYSLSVRRINTECSSSTRVTIGASQNSPIVVANSNSPICEGEPLYLTGTEFIEGYLYHWDGPNNFTSNQLAPIIENTTSTYSGIYNLTITATNGCSNSNLTNVLVKNRMFHEFSEIVCDEFVWNNEVYTTSGDYIQNFTGANGCDSIVTLHLTIHHSTRYEVSVTTCDSYIWNNITYTQSGNYSQSFETTNGCDSIVTLILSIHPKYAKQVNVTICEGQTYNFFGQILTVAGNYTHLLQSVDNCDSVINLTLEVNEYYSVEISESICQGESYNFFGQHLMETGFYNHNLQSISNCDSTIWLHLTVNDSDTSEFSETVCDSYRWNNDIYTQSGNYTRIFQSDYGCDSVETLLLTVHHSTTYDFSETACNRYIWNNITYTESGDYSQSLETMEGCDSVVTLHLTINFSTTFEFFDTVCDRYIWNHETYTQSGKYEQQFQTALGCDSIVMLHLTINESETHEFTETACDSFNWNGETYTQSGDYEQQLHNANDCDSTITLHLTINESETHEFTETACYSFNWNDETFTQSGDYTQQFHNALDCDSIVILHLTINPSTTHEFSETDCDSYTWNNETYTQSGNYVQQFQTAFGCDSVATLQLTINESNVYEFAATACDSYTWNDETHTQSGDYEQQFSTIDGCDSIVILHLIVHTTPSIPTYTITENTVCNGIPDGSITITSPIGTDYEYSINETNYQQNTVFSQLNSGVYSLSVRRINTECSSSTRVTIGASQNSPIVVANSNSPICEGEPLYLTGTEFIEGYLYHWDGPNNFTSNQLSPIIENTTSTYSGIYNLTITATNGCSNSNLTNVLVKNRVFHEFSEIVCDEFVWNNEVYTTSGDYIQNFIGSNGCDSIVTLHLTIHHSTRYEVSVTTCDSYIWNNETYTESGDYVQTFHTSFGCDSVVTLHLTINELTTHEFSNTSCDFYIWNEQMYTESGSYIQTFYTQSGCDSIETLLLIINNSAIGDTTVESCASFNWYGTTYTESGDYEQTLQTIHGCDSVVTMHLTINHSSFGDTTAEACDTFTWHGITYTENGNYEHLLQTIHGCDSIVTLHLTIHHSTFGDTTAEVCDSFHWYGTTYSESGNYEHTLHTIHGCDSVVLLHLTIHHPATHEFFETTCENYVWNEETYTHSGNYFQSFQTIDGCDSTVFLSLTINHKYTTQVNVSICEGQTYNFYGQILTIAGNYSHTLQSVFGCDSIINLSLNINSFYSIEYSESICHGEHYNFFGNELMETGIYRHTLQSITRCDSTIILQLTVKNTVSSEFSETACNKFIWNNETYTSSGTYQKTFTASNGCDSTVFLNLTIYENETNDISDTACNSYFWNDDIYLYSGTYMQSYESIHGCDSTVTLHLTVNNSASTNPESFAICEGEFKEWNGETYSISGTYYDTLTTVYGCDSIQTLILTVNQPPEIAIHGALNINTGDSTTLTASGAVSYLWSTGDISESIIVSPTDSTIYSVVGTDVNGCSSTTTISVMVTNNGCDTIYHEFSHTACDSYIWNNETYIRSGTYTQSFQTFLGCDSIVTLHLTINPAIDYELIKTACDEYEWNNIVYTTSGIYSQHFQTIQGCDSIITLYLTINYSSNPTIIDTISCEIFKLNGFLYQVSGDYSQTIETQNHCDSIIDIHLTIAHSDTVEFSDTIFEYNVYQNYGFNLSVDTINYLRELSGSNTFDIQRIEETILGCDSIIVVHLTLKDLPIYQFSIVRCDSAIMGGQTYYETTIDTIFQENRITILNITITHSYHISNEITLCHENSYFWHGQTITEAGIYYDSLLTYHRPYCDSIYTLFVYSPFYASDTLFSTICEGESFEFEGELYTETGVYVDSLTGQLGCDSLRILSLTVNPSYYFDLHDTICYGENYDKHGITISKDSIDELLTTGNPFLFTQAYTTYLNCDSIYYLSLLVQPEIIATASSNAPILIETDIQLFASGGNSYQWSGPNNFVSNEQNPVIEHADIIHSSNYEVIVSDSITGCFDTKIVPVSVLVGRIYVVSNGAGNQTGYSWNNAFASIQQGIETASTHQPPLEVWVAAGRYFGDSIFYHNAFTLKNGVNVFGGFAGYEAFNFNINDRNFEENATILDGQHVQRILYQETDCSVPTTWDGFVFENGKTNEQSGIHISGGGIYLRANGIVKNSLIQNNSSTVRGGGAYIEGVGSRLENCILKNNFCNQVGGGACISDSSSIIKCKIIQNESITAGGGLGILGNGYSDSCIIKNNTTCYSGGGLLTWGNDCFVENAEISGNKTTAVEGNECGAGVCIYQGTVKNSFIHDNFHSGLNEANMSVGAGVYMSEVENNAVSNLIGCVVTNNTAKNYGGGIYMKHGCTVINCTVANNLSQNSEITENVGSGIYVNGNDESTIINSIVWGNVHNDFASNIFCNESNNSNLIIKNCAVENDYLGIDIISLSSENDIVFGPKFVAPSILPGHNIYDTPQNIDWNILENSICINRGILDMSEYPISSTDLSGNARIQSGRIDIGAFETPYTAVVPNILPDAFNILYVTELGGGIQNGSSWENALSDLQLALDYIDNFNLEETVRIWVANGIYSSNAGIGDLAFNIRNSVQTFGSFAGTEIVTSFSDIETYQNNRNFTENATILDGQNSQRVLCQMITDETDRDCIWDGFVIANGLVTNNKNGGGALVYNNVVFRNCRFENNKSNNRGGGLWMCGNSKIENCTFENNTADNGGGGLYLKFGTIENSLVINNKSTYGAGLLIEDSGMAINCIFRNNRASNIGGGCYLLRGGIVCNSLISNNTGLTIGGGGAALSFGGKLINCTIVRNYILSSTRGGGIRSQGGEIVNSIIWGNRRGDISDQVFCNQQQEYSGTTLINYCAIEGGYSGYNTYLASGNIGAGYHSPYFIRPTSVAGITEEVGDWQLRDTSMCVNRGLNNQNPLTTDLAGNQRIQNDTIDIGAYESPYFANDLSNSSNQKIIYVSEGGRGLKNGTSWENAVAHIFDAQNLISAEDTSLSIWVSRGIYYTFDSVSQLGENGLFMLPNVAIYGGFFGNEPPDCDLLLRNFEENKTILDGRNRSRLLFQTNVFEQDVITVVDGFYLQNGYHPISGGAAQLQTNGFIRNCIIQNNKSGVSAGGVLFYGGGNLINCYVQNNESQYGGGLYVQYIDDFTFKKDSIINCIFLDNYASKTGGGFFHQQNDENFESINLIVSNNTFVKNRSDSVGAAFYGENNLNIYNSIFWNNHSNLEEAQYHWNNLNHEFLYNAVQTNEILVDSTIIPLSDINSGISDSVLYPKFYDPVDNNYRLHESSPLINKGFNDYVFSPLDCDGTSRIINDTVDMGAFEVMDFSPCDAISHLQLDSIYKTTVWMSWFSEGEQLYYVVTITNLETGESFTTQTPIESLMQSNLLPNTHYKAEVFKKCLDNNSGLFSIPIYFYTECDTSSFHRIENIDICFDAESFMWHNVLIDHLAVGDTVFYDINQTECGADSIYELHVTVLNELMPPIIDTIISLCDNQTATMTAVINNDATTCRWYTHPHQGNIEATGLSYTTPPIPKGEPVNYWVSSYNEFFNCESERLMISITAYPIYNDTTFVTSCDSLLWNDTTIFESGIYTKYFNTFNQCDSIVTIDLTINYSSSFEVADTIFSDEPFNQYGFQLPIDSIAQLVVLAQNQTIHCFNHAENSVGCDSTAQLTLTVIPVITIDSMVSACNFFEWNDSIYYNSGIYSFRDEDTIINLHLSIHESSFESESISICDTAYQWHEQVINTSGLYYDSLTNFYGCDSVFELIFTATTSYYAIETASICDGETFNFHGHLLTESGIFRDTLTSLMGCDSIIDLTLTVFRSDTLIFTDEICKGINYHDNGFMLSADSILQMIQLTENQTIEFHRIENNIFSCDSLILLNLTVKFNDSIFITDTICEGNSLIVFNDTLTTSGIYTVHQQNANNCDNVAIVSLLVNPSYIIRTTESICEGDSLVFNGEYLTESGTYQAFFTTQLNCDSIIELTLIVHPKIHPIIYGENELCYGDSTTLYVNEGMHFLWSTGEHTPSIIVHPTSTTVYSIVIIDENGCYAEAEIEIHVDPPLLPYIIGNNVLCIGDSTTLTVVDGGNSFLWNTNDTTQSITVSPTQTTTYSVSTVNSNGCVFYTNIHIIVNHPIAPTEVVAVNFQSYIVVVWMEQDDNYHNYQIYRDDELLDIVSGNIYYDSTVEYNQLYCYYLKTIESENCLSLPSNSSCMMLSYYCYTPTNLTAMTKGEQTETEWVELQWNTAENANDYIVFRDNIEIAITNNNFYNDTIHQRGTVCYHVISACDYEIESLESNQACVYITDVDENSDNIFKIYPNPARYQITIEGENLSKATLYNSLGQEMATQIAHETLQLHFNVSTFENGLYLLKIITKQGTVFSQKVVITQ